MTHQHGEHSCAGFSTRHFAIKLWLLPLTCITVSHLHIKIRLKSTRGGVALDRGMGFGLSVLNSRKNTQG